jgi:hypothetical protein
MQLKYIRTKSGFIVWPDMTTVYHKHMAALAGEPVISAGFCIFLQSLDSEGAEFKCYGRSESLDISSRPEDSELMTAFFENRCERTS